MKGAHRAVPDINYDSRSDVERYRGVSQIRRQAVLSPRTAMQGCLEMLYEYVGERQWGSTLPDDSSDLQSQLVPL